MSLAILNVGEGDTKISFDKDKPEEVERSRRIVTDMLKLGYAIMVRIATHGGKPQYRRAVDFDPLRDEYVVTDVPEAVEAAPQPRPLKRGRRARVTAVGTPAIAVARSAGGMSDRDDSIEMQNMERFDSCARTRNRLRMLANKSCQWAGIPLPLERVDLVMDPLHPFAKVYETAQKPPPDDKEDDATVRNRFYSVHKRQDVLVWQADGSDKVAWGAPAQPSHHFGIDLETMGASDAWGIEQEANALQLLATLLPHHAFKKYLLTGMFVEQSERSGVYYFFRRLKPTIAASSATGEMRILAALCAHPIAYYAGTWAGAMCPTDDVIAHLTLMRGDEPMYWRRCNQHEAHRREAGL